MIFSNIFWNFIDNINFYKKFNQQNIKNIKNINSVRESNILNNNTFSSYFLYSKYDKKNVLFPIKKINIDKNLNTGFSYRDLIFNLFRVINDFFKSILWNFRFTFVHGFYYIQSFFVILFIDALLCDDEPLWEPIEWSMVQTWILFIFVFGWIAENLITSRFGSYVGRDKRVWMGWYKTFWLIDIFYAVNFLIVACFVITPFYFEITYSLPFVHTWWNWYNRVFFFRFISIMSIVIILCHVIQISIRWLNWKKLIMLIILVNLFLSYLLYTHFIMSFFGYLTNPLWYQNNRAVDYIQISHEPSKWGWGLAKRDHFSYHSVSTVFWFKNDGPFASALLLFHMYIFLTLFLIFIYWIALFRRVYSTREVPITYTTYCVGNIKQFFYGFLYLYFFVFLSFIIQYWRLPIEHLWVLNNQSWLNTLLSILLDYPRFLCNIFLNFFYL